MNETIRNFQVAIGNSTRMDRTPAPDEVCGHKHRTIESAEKCASKLLGFDRITKQCSAKWYNAFIVAETETGFARIR